MHITSQLQSESRSNQHPVFQPTPRQELNMFSDQLHPNCSHGFVQASGPGQPCSRSVEYVPAFTTPTPFTHMSEASYGPRFPAQHRPPYPSPYPNSFIVYLLGFCPVQTSVCFGCGSSLKPGGQIGNPPADLVIVSNMHKEWRQDGETRRKAANVYFHCILDCVRRKQPFFRPNQCFMPQQIVHFFTQEYKLCLAQKFGNLTIS